MRKNLKRWIAPLLAAAMTITTAVPGYAEDTVNVTVPNVKGGYLRVSYERGDTTVYLPIGETVKVPKGTDLNIWARNIEYYDANDNYITTAVRSVSANGKELEPEYEWEESYEWTADSNTTFDATFIGTYEDSELDESESNSSYVTIRFKDKKSNTVAASVGTTFSEQLGFYNYGTKSYSNVTDADSVEIDSQAFNPYEGNSENIELFAIENGVLTTGEDKLENADGEYRVKVTWENGSRTRSAMLRIFVGESVHVNAPLMAVWANEEGNNDDYGYWQLGRDGTYALENPATDTFQKYIDEYQEDSAKYVIANHETLSGVGVYVFSSNKYNMYSSTEKVSGYLKSCANTAAYVDLVYENFKPAVIEYPDAANIFATVDQGWNEKNGKWYYYETEDPTSLKTDEWIACRDDDGQDVWVGSDGALVTNGIAGKGDERYWVDGDGHIDAKVNETKTIDDVDYVFENGKLVETKMHLSAPKSATEMIAQAEKVLDNIDTVSKDDLVSAADLQTKALYNVVETEKLTAEDVAKIEKLYVAAYGADNITVTDGVTGGIAAAGLTSEDFDATGSVTIEYKIEWIGTSSNAIKDSASASNASSSNAARSTGDVTGKVSVRLYVNGVERNEFTAPITITVQMSDEFCEAYSSSQYTFKVADATDVTVDTANKVLTMTISKPGVYEIQPSAKHSSSGSGSSGGSSSSRSTKTTGRTATPGTWILDAKGWWFRYEDGTWPANCWAYLTWNNENKWYFFDAEGYLKTGWLLWNNSYYYLYPIADGNKGYMFTGWHQIDGKWYYFSKLNDATAGIMASDTTTPDGYKVGKDGAWIQ